MPLSSEYLQHVPFKICFLLFFFLLLCHVVPYSNQLFSQRHIVIAIFINLLWQKQEIAFDIQQREADVFQIGAKVNDIQNIKYSHWKYEYKKTEDILWVLITLCYFLRIWLNWVGWTFSVEGITNCEDYFMLRHNAFRLASL